VKAPAEPIDLDDVALPDSLKSHRWQAYARARRTSPPSNSSRRRAVARDHQRSGSSLFRPDDQKRLVRATDRRAALKRERPGTGGVMRLDSERSQRE
jgi:hypothetical protein